MSSHPDYERLLRGFERLRHEDAVAWHGVVYRSAAERYASSSDLLSGEGSRKHGGRWNPAGSFATVYGSSSPEVAMAETVHQYRYYGIEPWRMGRRLFTAIDVHVGLLVDLTSGRLRRRLRVSARRMREADWRRSLGTDDEAITQALGRAAFTAGIEALKVPSSAGVEGANFVVFPGNLGPESGIREIPPVRGGGW